MRGVKAKKLRKLAKPDESLKSVRDDLKYSEVRTSHHSLNTTRILTDCWKYAYKVWKNIYKGKI